MQILVCRFFFFFFWFQGELVRFQINPDYCLVRYWALNYWRENIIGKLYITDKGCWSVTEGIAQTSRTNRETLKCSPYFSWIPQASKLIKKSHKWFGEPEREHREEAWKATPLWLPPAAAACFFPSSPVSRHPQSPHNPNPKTPFCSLHHSQTSPFFVQRVTWTPLRTTHHCTLFSVPSVPVCLMDPLCRHI